MALIPCSNCGGKMSDRAEKCPHCGYAPNILVQQREDYALAYDPKKSNHTLRIIISIILFIAATTFIILGVNMFKKEANSSEELYNSGIEALKNDDYAQAEMLLLSASEKGSTDAMNELGCLYQKGIGVKQDYSKALEWLKKAATQDNSDAMNGLGYMYLKGTGVEQDYQKSYEWFKKGAEKGLAEAQFNLGICYAKGEGVQQDYDTAIKWIKQAAEQGHENAIKALKQIQK